MNPEKYTQLRAKLAEITSLENTVRLLSWDRETYMPPGGAAGRSDQLALLNGLHHDRLTSDDLGSLLEDLSAGMDGVNPDGDEARIVKVMKRDFDRERRLPKELVEEVSRAGSDGLTAWHKAREAKDFSLFAPSLARNAALNRQLADAYGYADRPYDAFVDGFEPGMTTAQLDTIFSELKAAIVPLVREIARRQDMVDDSCLSGDFDSDTQQRFGLEIAERYGYDVERGGLALTAHPFCMPMGPGDVRITTRVAPDRLDECLLSTLHESGHGMYEQGISAALASTPVGHGASAGVHESQSRLWENLVGRSRPFQDYLFPRLQQTFPDQLGSVDIETFYRAINKVQPSLIRTAADEVTYNLHIMLRFELENEMLEDRVDINNLDKIWNERMQQYLGVIPQNDAEGVLQDIHWSIAGNYGFPGYTLGNLIGAQVFRAARKTLPDLDGQISRGEFAGLLAWLQTNIYQHGRKFTSNELMQRITGEPVGTQAWIDYVQGKFSAIYGL
jgi:carboxypeptidase Taq